MDLLWFALDVFVACLKLVAVYGALLFAKIIAGFSATIVFLFQTWVFQAVFGAWVVFALQQFHQTSTQKADRFQKRYDQKLAAIQLFFSLVDKRIYATRLYRATLLSDEPDQTWISERESYRDAVREWNERAPGLIVTLLTLLPARLCFQLERETFQRFASMDVFLGRARRAREAGRLDEVSSNQVKSLLLEMSELTVALLAEFLNLARAEARLIDRKPMIASANQADLSLSYLVTSLFKSTIN